MKNRAMIENYRATEQTFDVYGLRNATVDLRVIPELGGRLFSLRDRRTGREWMWHPPGELKLFRNAFGDPFKAGTFAGLDECLPTIGACEWKGRQLPDHGEVWALPWKLDSDAFGSGKIAVSVRAPVSGFEFERTLSLDENVVTLDYRLTNPGNACEEFLWSIHPLLTLEEDDGMELPEEVSELRIEGGIGIPNLVRGAYWNYPAPFENYRLDRLQLGDNRDVCVKCFTPPLKEGRSAIFNNRTGDRLEFRWNTAENDTLGVWLTRGGLNTWHHVALEPTNGAPDSLALAVSQWKRHGLLEPGATKRWSVSLIIG